MTILLSFLLILNTCLCDSDGHISVLHSKHTQIPLTDTEFALAIMTIVCAVLVGGIVAGTTSLQRTYDRLVVVG
jgi:hypothetical protein